MISDSRVAVSPFDFAHCHLLNVDGSGGNLFSKRRNSEWQEEEEEDGGGIGAGKSISGIIDNSGRRVKFLNLWPRYKRRLHSTHSRSRLRCGLSQRADGTATCTWTQE